MLLSWWWYHLVMILSSLRSWHKSDCCNEREVSNWSSRRVGWHLIVCNSWMQSTNSSRDNSTTFANIQLQLQMETLNRDEVRSKVGNVRLKCALRLLYIMFSSEILILLCFRIYIILSYLIFPLKQGTSCCAKFMESLSTDSLLLEGSPEQR